MVELLSIKSGGNFWITNNFSHIQMDNIGLFSSHIQTHSVLKMIQLKGGLNK